MKNLYCNRLRKNKDKEITLDSKSSFPLKQYISIGNKLNSLTDIVKIGVNRSEYFKYNKNSNTSNNLIKSYNQSGVYMQNYQNKNKSRCNNHSLYDSNKQKLINIENTRNYVRFESNNLDKEKNNKKYHLSSNNSIYNSIKNKNIHNNIRNYTVQKNYFNNNITNINYNIKIQNFTKKNSPNISLHTINFNTTSTKNNKYLSHIKNDIMQNRNYLSSLKKNYNFTEINESKKKKTQKNINHQKNQSIQRNLTENIYKKEKDKNQNKEIHSPSIVKTQIFTNLKNERNNTTNNKTNINIYNLNEEKFKINLPIKLNIEDINKEKLSRLKRIIEKSSTNLNFYKNSISKNFFEKNEKSLEKNIKLKKGKTPYIFKKKKISSIKKEENKNQKISNNISIKSPNKKMNKKKNLILSTQLYNNTNYKFESIMNTQKTSYKNTDYNAEIKNQILKKNEINNGNNDDTISLSYSKEQNISIISKRNNINEKNLFIPFSIEQFYISYDKRNKSLKINDKNIYQLAKEIILLKRGLAKKNELSNELRKKMKNMRMQRIYTLNLLGNHRVLYRKKTSNYKLVKC